MVDILKNNFQKLYKTGFFHIFSANVINKILLFCNGIFIVKVLSKESFGIYSYSQNLLSLFLLFSGLGINNGLLQFASRSSKEEREDIFRFTLRLGVIINIILTGIVVLYCQFGNFKIEEGRKILVYMIGFPIFTIIIDSFLIYWRAELKNKEMSILSTINTFSTVIFMIVGGYLYDLQGVILGKYIGFIVVVIVIIKYTTLEKIKSYFLKTELTFKLKKEIIKYSLAAQVNNSIISFIHMIDIFSIGLLIGDKYILASYKAANVIPFGLEFIPHSIMIYIYPYFVRNNKNKSWISRNYKKIMYILFGMNLFIVGFILIFGKLIILKVFGQEYIDSIKIFKVLCIGYFFTGTFRVLGANILFALGKPKFNIYSSVIACVSNIILNYFLIQKYGSIGAAYATVIVFIIWSLLVNIFIYKELKENYV
nr:polysaccharide biosynthesis C-terminal domain-containing protein [uncultured Fusobacterium sp.]